MRFLPAPVALAAVVVSALALVAPASAKELRQALICGASGCVTLDRPPRTLASFGDGVPDGSPAPGPYYRVVLSASEFGAGWLIWYVPGEGSTAYAGSAGRTQFERLDPETNDAFQRVVRGVRPYAAPVVTAAFVDGEPAADPSSYLSLTGRPNELDEPPIAGDCVLLATLGTFVAAASGLTMRS